MLKKIFPFVRWVDGYSFNGLRTDALAGLTVALVLIPQSMAYAQLAGLPAYYGLYASFLPPMVAALFGSSRQLATGPVAVILAVGTRGGLSPAELASWIFGAFFVNSLLTLVACGPETAEACRAAWILHQEYGLETRVPDLLSVIQKGIYDRALKFRQDNTRPAGSYEEFKEQIESLGGFFEALWCGDSRCEAKIKEETKATIRCIPLEGQDRNGPCLQCGSPARTRVYLARAY